MLRPIPHPAIPLGRPIPRGEGTHHAFPPLFICFNKKSTTRQMTSLSNHLLRLLAFSLLAVTLTAIPAYGQSPEYGLVNVSACNTRSEAAYSAGQESQAVMGMPVEILGRHHEWTHIRTPEGYEHWADQSQEGKEHTMRSLPSLSVSIRRVPQGK